jgi:hypothetical protein
MPLMTFLFNKSVYVTIINIMKLYTLTEAADIVHLEAVTLRKYCNAGKCGTKIGPVPLDKQNDKRPWYLTEKDLQMIKDLPHNAHKAGRPKKS